MTTAAKGRLPSPGPLENGRLRIAGRKHFHISCQKWLIAACPEQAKYLASLCSKCQGFTVTGIGGNSIGSRPVLLVSLLLRPHPRRAGFQTANTDVNIRRASLCASQSRQPDQITVPCVTVAHPGADQSQSSATCRKFFSTTATFHLGQN